MKWCQSIYNLNAGLLYNYIVYCARQKHMVTNLGIRNKFDLKYLAKPVFQLDNDWDRINSTKIMKFFIAGISWNVEKVEPITQKVQNS